jgi:hypothetical protein
MSKYFVFDTGGIRYEEHATANCHGAFVSLIAKLWVPSIAGNLQIAGKLLALQEGLCFVVFVSYT